MSLRWMTLGCAGMDARWKVHERTANAGPEVTEYLRNAGINVAAPWCAAAVQFWSDTAAGLLAVKNPLDDVKLEAYVQSYFQWADESHALVKESQALPGDLVLYSFGKKRWDHIGLLLDTPVDGSFRAIEGNTNAAGGREGDGVLVRLRGTKKGYPVQFVRWTP